MNRGELSATELLHGWAEHHCPVHGFLVATIAWGTVRCACGKTAIPHRAGRPLKRRDQKSLQIAISESVERPLAA